MPGNDHWNTFNGAASSSRFSRITGGMLMPLMSRELADCIRLYGYSRFGRGERPKLLGFDAALFGMRLILVEMFLHFHGIGKALPWAARLKHRAPDGADHPDRPVEAVLKQPSERK